MRNKTFSLERVHQIKVPNSSGDKKERRENGNFTPNAVHFLPGTDGRTFEGDTGGGGWTALVVFNCAESGEVEKRECRSSESLERVRMQQG